MTKIHGKLFCYIYHVLQANLKTIAQLKPCELLFTRQTAVLRSSLVAPSLRKRVRIPQWARIFHFVILARLAFLTALGSPCKVNQPWHTRSQYHVLDIGSKEKNMAFVGTLFSRRCWIFKNWMLILVLLCENEHQRWDASRYIKARSEAQRFYVYRDAYHLWRSFSHNRTKIKIQNL